METFEYGDGLHVEAQDLTADQDPMLAGPYGVPFDETVTMAADWLGYQLRDLLDLVHRLFPLLPLLPLRSQDVTLVIQPDKGRIFLRHETGLMVYVCITENTSESTSWSRSFALSERAHDGNSSPEYVRQRALALAAAITSQEVERQGDSIPVPTHAPHYMDN
jgi:hypothetical protein